MATLAINTASSTTSIALITEQRSFQDSWPSANNEAEKLLPNIKKLIEQADTKFPDIDQVMVVKGPGSFTGLRIGVTVANTIANLNKAKLQAIDAFQYWWQALADVDGETDTVSKPTPDTALLIYAGSGGVYLVQNRETAANAQIINIPDLNQYLIDHKTTKVFGDISEEQKSQIEAAEFIQINPDFAQTISKFINQAETLPLVEPVYIKKPGITQPKNALHRINTNR